MRLQHIVEHVYTRPWAITPAGWESIHNIVQSKLRGEIADFRAEDGEDEDIFGEKLPGYAFENGTGIIPVKGVIARKIGLVGKMCGGCDLIDIENNLAMALNDDYVERIVLDVDSPGGSVTGVPEVARRIKEADAIKPVYAYTDGMMCSAAYWLASQARGIVCTPTAEVGSIGVYMAILDYTRAMEMEGTKLELFKAGALKAMGLPGTTLTEEMRDHLQAQVDTIYDWFTSDVKSRRPTVSEETMQGQSFMGDDASARELVDGIADNWLAAMEEFKTYDNH